MEWSFSSDQPIYTQLVDTIRQGIVSGALPPGARLLPVRELAAEAGVNPNTMQRALQELERAGLVYSQRTAGRFVTEDAAAVERLREDMAGRQVRAFLDTMAKLGYGRAEILARLGEETDRGAEAGAAAGARAEQRPDAQEMKTEEEEEERKNADT